MISFLKDNKILTSIFFLFPVGFITGPFLSDFLLSLLGLLFLYLTYKLKLWQNYNNLFIKFSLLFFLWIVISGFLSNHLYSSLIDYGGPIFFFRNIIFVVCVVYFFETNEKYLKIIYISLFTVLTFVVFDAIFQFIFGSNLLGMKSLDYNRLTGIFGKEQILGHFLSYSFPIFVSLYFFFNRNIFKRSYLFGLFSLVILFVTFISGDRTGFLKLIIFLSILGIIVKEFRKTFLSSLFVLLCTIYLLINFNEKSSIRFDDTVRDISLNKSFLPISPGHEDLFLSGLNIFLDYPIKGAGPQMYRVLCPDNPKYSLNGVCTTHVHNYYIQSLSELGFIGLIFMISLYLSLLINFFKNLLSNNKNYPLLIINLHLLVTLLPIISHANFYNNWVNPLLALSFAIYLFLNQKLK